MNDLLLTKECSHNTMKYKFIFIYIVIALYGCSSDNYYPEIISGNIQKYTIFYGEYSKNQLDIYTTNTTAYAPVVVFIHGGGWYSGDKSDWNLPQIKCFAQRHYVSISMNYRLTPEVTHPQHIQDVAQAIKWIEQHIKKYGGDSSNLILIGHSAGAHLAALAVTNQKYLKQASANIQHIKVVYLLDAGAYLNMDTLIGENPSISTLVQNAIGTTQLKYDFTPYNFISKNKYYPKFYLIHSDNPYRSQANALFKKELDKNNIYNEEYTLTGYSHSDILKMFPSYLQ